MSVKLRRLASGSYVCDHPWATATAYYRIERGWADEPSTDRRRQTWVLTRVESHLGGGADVLSDHPTLGAARDEIARLLTRVNA